MADIPFLDALLGPSPGEEHRRKVAAQLDALRRQGKTQDRAQLDFLADPVPTQAQPTGMDFQNPGMIPRPGPTYEPPPAPDIPVPDVNARPELEGPYGPVQQQAPATPPGRPSALPQATGAVKRLPGGGATAPPVAPAGVSAAPAGGLPAARAAAGGPAPGSPEARILELERLRDEATKPPDLTAAQEAYQKRAGTAGGQMALALMAQQAKMDPASAYHLKQAAAAREPMKMVGGTMTETGFVEDPGFKQEQTVKRLEAQIVQQQRIQQSNADRASKEEAAEKERAFRKELQSAQLASTQAIAAASLEERRAAREDRAAERGAKAGKGGMADPQDMLNVIQEARGYLKNATGSGFGTAVDAAGRFIGHATEGAKATARLGPVAAKLTMMQPRMEGPQSDADRRLYQQAAGDAANSELTVGERMAALDAMEAMANKYKSGYWAPPGYTGAGGRRSTDRGGGNVVDYSSLK